MKVFLVIALVMMCVSCASSRKAKILTGMAVSFGTAYAVGQSLTPEGDNRDMHGVLYGGLASAITGATMVYFLSESEELKESKNKVIELRSKMQSLEKKQKEKLTGKSLPDTDYLPEEIRKLIKPGTWKLYEIDQWIRRGDMLIHQDLSLIHI